jgi:hypothetical protein
MLRLTHKVVCAGYTEFLLESIQIALSPTIFQLHHFNVSVILGQRNRLLNLPHRHYLLQALAHHCTCWVHHPCLEYWLIKLGFTAKFILI